MRAFFNVTQGEGGIDNTQMSECLREISECFTRFGIDLFRKKIEIVRETQCRLIKLVRLVEPSAACEKINFPETAKRERAFPSIFALLLAMNEPNPRYESLE